MMMKYSCSRRRLAAFFLILVTLTCSGASLGKTTSDPNHKGWSGSKFKVGANPVTWKPVEAKCENCKQMVAQFNDVMNHLLATRYQLEYWRTVRINPAEGSGKPLIEGKKGEITAAEKDTIAWYLEADNFKSRMIESRRTLIKTLEQQASYLRGAIIQCELTACGKGKKPKIKAIEIGGESAAQPFSPNTADILTQHGVAWQGPYNTDCLPCTGTVSQLNAVPGWVIRAHFKLQASKQRLNILLDEKNQGFDIHGFRQPDDEQITNMEKEVVKHKAELKALAQLFEKLLGELKTCEAKYCKPTQDADISLGGDNNLISIGSPTVCDSPAAHEPITIGANNEVGSSANFKEKTKKKITGAAVGAVANLIGLGGGGGSKSKGPPTYKDPIKKKQKTRVRDKEAKRDFYAGGAFTENGLLISSDIMKAPGKGTFHTIYLENERGWRLMPIALFMYEIWRDWKLSVSWTRDTYVDGELVKHEEGGWTESWRELIARGEETIYAEVMDEPLWEQLGFNTAVSGARSLGTLFPVSPQMLVSGQWNLVVHVSDPKKDPVTTVPYIFELSLDNKGQVVAEPAETTIAHQQDPCAELIAVTPSTPVATEPDNPVTENIPEWAAISHLVSSPVYGHPIPRSQRPRKYEPDIDELFFPNDDTLASLFQRGDEFLINMLALEDGEPRASLSVLLDNPKISRSSLLYDYGEVAPAPSDIRIVTSKPGFTENPATDKFNFDGEGATLQFSSDYSALSDLPAETQLSPSRNASGASPSTSFVLTFSEPMDEATVEDNFIVNAFSKPANADNEVSSETFDRSQFDVNWNDESTEATFSFNGNPRSEAEIQEGQQALDRFWDEWRNSKLLPSDPFPVDHSFEQLIRLENSADDYLAQFGLEPKRETLMELIELKQELLDAGFSEESTPVTKVEETITTLARQIAGAEEEVSSRQRRFAEALTEYSRTFGGNFTPENLPPSYVKYKQQRESHQQQKQKDPLHVVSVVDVASHTEGSHVLSNRAARAILNKYKRWANGEERFHSVLAEIGTGIAQHETPSATDRSIKMLKSDHSNSYLSMACPLGDAWGFGISNPTEGLIFGHSPDTKFDIRDCAIKSVLQFDKLLLSDYFDASAFNQSPLNSQTTKLSLKKAARSAVTAQANFNSSNADDEFQDRDGDGIEDSIDTQPDTYSDEFTQSGDGVVTGKILNRNGNVVKVQDLGYEGVRISVDSQGEGASGVQLLGIDLELDQGTLLDANFG